MLLNEDFGKEWLEAINRSPYKKTYLAEKLGISKAQFNNMRYRKMVSGLWIDALDAAGYDVEVIIKPKENK